jgi:hypothetical protein
MYINPFDYQTAQLCLEDRIREAQACHARQRRMAQQLARVLTWLGNQLIAWGRRLQTQQQILELQGN